jgi:tripartite-type tricarboxylate transporter receptor subunit TctC
MNRRKLLSFSLAALGAPRPTGAQTAWNPTRPIVLVVPFAPGGPNDLVARLVAPQMQAAFAQNVLVENRPGATGAIGARHVMTQPADGHTLIIAGSGTLTTNPVVMARPGYDPEKDFAPITLAMSAPNMLVVHKDVPASSLTEVVRWLKHNDGRIAYSSGGVGSPEQLGMELFLRAAGAVATHVPFPGGAPAVAALIQGVVQVSVLNAATVKPHLVSGALRAIAVTAPRRFAPLPDVPTMIELGYPEVISASWSAFLAPVGTPSPSVMRLHEVITTILRRPEVTERLAAIGFSVDATAPEELGRIIMSDLGRWRRVVREAGIQVN